MAGRMFCSRNNEYFMKRIVIIGAGIAGLACANRLRQLGFNNVIVLEARNRIGGRINSIKNGMFYFFYTYCLYAKLYEIFICIVVFCARAKKLKLYLKS